MPRIPRALGTYDAPTQQVAPIRGGNLDIAPDRSGAIAGEQLQNIGSALQGAGKAWMDASTRMTLEENETRLKQAKQAADEYFGKYEVEAQQKKGLDVWGMSDKANLDYDGAKPQFEGALTNERQKADFGVIYGAMKSDSIRRLSTYEANTRTQVANDTDKSGITIETSRAAANAGDAATVDLAKQGVNAYVSALSARNGFTPQQREEAYLSTMTTFHTQVVESLIDSDPQRAMAYYQSAADANEIDGAKQVELKAKIETATGDKLAYGLADEMDQKGLSLTQARDALDKRDDLTPKVKKGAMEEFKTRTAERKSQTEQYQKQNSEEVYSRLLQGQTFDQIPMTLKMRGDPKAMLQLKELSDLQRTGASVKTDNATWLMLNEMMVRDPVGFASKVNLAEYAAKLSQSDLQAFANDRTKILNKETPDAVTWDQQLSTYVDQLDLGGSSNDEARATFKKSAQDAISEAQKAKGKPLDYAERQAVIDPLIVEGKISRPGWFNDSSGRAYQLSGEEGFGTQFQSKAGEPITSIRPEVRIGLTEAYKRRNGGKMPSEAQVLSAYENYIKKGGSP